MPYAQDELVLLVPPNHKLAQQGSIDKCELYNLNFVSMNQGSSVQAMQEETLLCQGIKWHKLHTHMVCCKPCWQWQHPLFYKTRQMLHIVFWLSACSGTIAEIVGKITLHCTEQIADVDASCLASIKACTTANQLATSNPFLVCPGQTVLLALQ